jgi:hypothetical protein
MDSDDELMSQTIEKDEANAATNEGEHLKTVTVVFSIRAKCRSQTWMFKVWEKEDRAAVEDLGALHALRRLFC